jgi:hypothetical protein
MDALDLLKRFETVARLNDLGRPNEIGSIFELELSAKLMNGHKSFQTTQRPPWLESMYYVITNSAEYKHLQKFSVDISVANTCIKLFQIESSFGTSYTELHNPPPMIIGNDPKAWQKIREAPRPNSFEYRTIVPGWKKSVAFSFGYTPCLRHFTVTLEMFNGEMP